MMIKGGGGMINSLDANLESPPEAQSMSAFVRKITPSVWTWPWEAAIDFLMKT